MFIHPKTTTVTTKGQVVIPKAIRDAFSLTPSTKVLFQVKGSTITLQPVATVDEMYAFLSGKGSKTTKEQQKAIVRQHVVKKFRKKNR